MARKTLYQTVDDKGNPDDVEKLGPFKCVDKPWLGEGYYFWDTFIELAHWWGRQGYNNSYMICEATCDDNGNIFDLVGNTEHIRILDQYRSLLNERRPNQEITVSFIIMHMIKILKDFPYHAIRAYGIDTINQNENLKKYRVKFNSNKRAYLDLMPAIQICIINKRKANLSGYRVIHPIEYVQDYTI